jgi:amino-acid N-acetyltransferase
VLRAGGEVVTPITIERAEAADRDAILALLDRVHLPKDGLAERFDHAFIAKHNGAVVGSAVLEMYADGALLRSVAVDPALQGSGLGAQLTGTAIARAIELRVPALYLLTTTAERFFPRFGFAPITRDDVPAGVRESVEFRSACPASAIVMRKELTPAALC